MNENHAPQVALEDRFQIGARPSIDFGEQELDVSPDPFWLAATRLLHLAFYVALACSPAVVWHVWVWGF